MLSYTEFVFSSSSKTPATAEENPRNSESRSKMRQKRVSLLQSRQKKFRLKLRADKKKRALALKKKNEEVEAVAAKDGGDDVVTSQNRVIFVQHTTTMTNIGTPVRNECDNKAEGEVSGSPISLLGEDDFHGFDSSSAEDPSLAWLDETILAWEQLTRQEGINSFENSQNGLLTKLDVIVIKDEEENEERTHPQEDNQFHGEQRVENPPKPKNKSVPAKIKRQRRRMKNYVRNRLSGRLNEKDSKKGEDKIIEERCSDQQGEEGPQLNKNKRKRVEIDPIQPNGAKSGTVITKRKIRPRTSRKKKQSSRPYKKTSDKKNEEIRRNEDEEAEESYSEGREESLKEKRFKSIAQLLKEKTKKAEVSKMKKDETEIPRKKSLSYSSTELLPTDIPVEHVYVDGECLYGIAGPCDGLTYDIYLKEIAKPISILKKTSITSDSGFAEFLTEIRQREALDKDNTPSQYALNLLLKGKCPEYLEKGSCVTRKHCIANHSFEPNWCHIVSRTETWSVICHLLNNNKTPHAEFFFMVLGWLSQSGDKVKIMCLIPAIFRLSTGCAEVWSCVVQSLVACRLKIWEAVNVVLRYCTSVTLSPIVVKMVLKYTRKSYPKFANMYGSFEFLMRSQFVVPTSVMAWLMKEILESGVPPEPDALYLVLNQIARTKNLNKIKDLTLKFIREMFDPASLDDVTMRALLCVAKRFEVPSNTCSNITVRDNRYIQSD